VVILQYGIVNVKQKNQEKNYLRELFFGTPFAVSAKMARGPLPMPKGQPASFLGSAAWLVSLMGSQLKT